MITSEELIIISGVTLMMLIPEDDKQRTLFALILLVIGLLGRYLKII